MTEFSTESDQKIEELASDWEQNDFKEEKNEKRDNSPFETKNIQNDDKVDNENWQENDDKDVKERAKIFRSF